MSCVLVVVGGEHRGALGGRAWQLDDRGAVRLLEHPAIEVRFARARHAVHEERELEERVQVHRLLPRYRDRIERKERRRKKK